MQGLLYCQSQQIYDNLQLNIVHCHTACLNFMQIFKRSMEGVKIEICLYKQQGPCTSQEKILNFAKTKFALTLGCSTIGGILHQNDRWLALDIPLASVKKR